MRPVMLPLSLSAMLRDAYQARKHRHGRHWAYHFRDKAMCLGRSIAFMMHKEGRLTESQAEERKRRMRQIAFVSNLDLPPEKAYAIFKR